MIGAFVQLNLDSPMRCRNPLGYIVQENGCWEWVGCITRTGYGLARPHGRKGGGTQAHRAVYQMMVGPIPEGLVLHHVCRNRLCVRPDHLEAVTQHENLLMDGSTIASQVARTHCPQGHPYAGDNLIARDGRRHCRACRNASKRRWTARKREARDAAA